LLLIAVGRVRSEPVPATGSDAATAAPSVATLEKAYREEQDDNKRAKIVRKLAALPGSTEVLRRVITDDPSDDVALAAAHALRRAAIGQVASLLDRRIQTGKRDPAARERMLREIERHQVFAEGQNLPRFLREAPPVFKVATRDRRRVRVLAFGDFGDGSDRQARIAEAMRRAHAKAPFDFAVTFGDNFYPAGLGSPDDERWERDFERLYGPMRIRFFPTLGNHDWVLADSPASEIARTTRSKVWQMPADRYTFTAGPAQFFAIDTNLISHAQLEWLDREIANSTARWKIVYGHHPIYSYGAHEDEVAVRDVLLPILKGRVDLYMCGHDHDLQQIAAEDGIHFVVAGGGGAATRPIAPGPKSLFAASKNGFAVVEATKATVTVSFMDEELNVLHRFTIPD
jgi:3',5'-cyclic AMP phosphodiesterase CpdA